MNLLNPQQLKWDGLWVLDSPQRLSREWGSLNSVAPLRPKPPSVPIFWMSFCSPPWARLTHVLCKCSQAGPASWGCDQSVEGPILDYFKIFFNVDHLKIFIEFVTILLLFYVLVFWPQGIWDPSSLTRDRTHTPCIGRQRLNHWTTREVPPPPASMLGLTF